MSTPTHNDTIPQLSGINGLMVLWVIAALIMIVLGIAFPIGSPQEDAHKEAAVDATAHEVGTASAKPRLGFKDRYITSEENFFTNIPYPSPLLQLSEEQLVGLRCSPFYSSLNATNQEFPFEQLNPEIITDTAVESVDHNTVIQEATNSLYELIDRRPDINGALYCRTDRDESFYVLHEGLGVTDQSTTVYFLYEKQLQMRLIGQVNNEETIPYFSCMHPIQLSQDGQLYWRCDGGDGILTAAFLYAINIESENSPSLILACQGTPDASVSCRP